MRTDKRGMPGDGTDRNATTHHSVPVTYPTLHCQALESDSHSAWSKALVGKYAYYLSEGRHHPGDLRQMREVPDGL